MKKLNPLILIIIWVIGCLLLSVIIMFYLGNNSSGGEQKPLVFFSKFIYVIIYGILGLAIFTIPFYKRWSKKFWLIHAGFILSCSLLIILGERNHVKTECDESDIILFSNGKTYTKRIDYYDDGKKIRSISFLLNDKKDSIWTVYSKDGDVISRLKYKNDILIETLK